VYLEDCGHCIEAEGMDYYMNHTIEEGEIKAKSCPKCKTIIRHCKRYGNILRLTVKDVMAVKKKIFGDIKKIQEDQMAKFFQLQSNFSKGWIQHFPVLGEFLANSLVDQVPLARGKNTTKIISKTVSL